MRKVANILSFIVWVLIIVGSSLLVFSLMSCGAYKEHIIAKHCPKQSLTIKDSIRITIKDSIVMRYKDSTRVHIKDSINIINRDSITIIKGGKADYIFNPLDSSKCALRIFSQSITAGNNTTSISSDGKNIYITSKCDDQVNYWKSLYINSTHSEEATRWMELYIKESHTSDSLKTHTQSEVIVKMQEHTIWERLKLSAFGDVCVLALFVLMGFMGFKVYEIFKKVTP